MINALSAELLKLLRLRATWLLAWSYPIVLIVIGALAIIYGLLSGKLPQPPTDAASWAADSAGFWSFPVFGFGRYLIASFAVFCTASEYSWNSWKFIVPARARWQLISAKIIAAMLLLLVAFLAADLVILVTSLLNALLVGPPIPDGVTASALLAAHFHGFVTILAPMLYTVVLATFLSVLTRSTLAAVLISIALIIFEELFPVTVMLAYGYAPAITAGLAEILPFHHIANIISWCQHDKAMVLLFSPDKTSAPGLVHSLAIVGLWTAALAALAIIRFERQDLD